MKWQVVAFEPFGGHSTNSSALALEALKSLDWNGEIEFLRPLPVSFKTAWPTLEKTLMSSSAQGVLALGQSGRRDRLNLERVALNWVDAKMPDNDQVVPKQGLLTDNEERALWSNIPWENLPDSRLWERSYSAGTYVCNALMFELLRWSKRSGKLAGFIHVPRFTGVPSMNEADAVQGLSEIMKFLVRL